MPEERYKTAREYIAAHNTQEMAEYERLRRQAWKLEDRNPQFDGGDVCGRDFTARVGGNGMLTCSGPPLPADRVADFVKWLRETYELE